MSVVLLFVWIETSNEYFDFDRWVSRFVFSFAKGLFSLIAIWIPSGLKRPGDIRRKMDKIGLSTVGGWKASLWGGVRVLNILSYYTLPFTYTDSHIWTKCVCSVVSLCFQCPQSYSGDSLTPLSSVFLSGLLMSMLVGVHGLYPWTLMSLPHLCSLPLYSVFRGLPRTLNTEMGVPS